MILVINLGLKSIRALVFDSTGRRVCSASLAVSTTLSGDAVEQSATEWWEKLEQVVSQVMEYPNVSSSVELVTVACSSSCLVAVDEKLNPLAPVVMVSDRRAKAEAEQIRALGVFQELQKKHSFVCNAYSQIARIKWFSNHRNDIYKNTDKFLSPNDFLLAKLSGGRIVTDDLNAEKLLYIPDENRYPNELYEAADLDARKLPDVQAPGSEVGVVGSDFSAKFKLNANTRLVLATYDAICSVFGTGVSAEGKACDVSGTVTSVRTYTDTPFNDPDGRVFCQRFSPTDGYLLGGSNNLGGGLIEWAKQCFYQNQEHPYEILEKEARASLPSLNGMIFVPHLLGARAPSWNSDARGIFFGIERHHTRGDMMRALMESIGYSIREFLDVFKEAGKEINVVTASGGLARISLANELKANIVQLPYHVMDEFESTCLGAAIIAMSATGFFESYAEACNAMVRTKQIFLPTNRDGNYYEDMYGLYREVNSVSGALFSRRLEILAALDQTNVDHIENL